MNENIFIQFNNSLIYYHLFLIMYLINIGPLYFVQQNAMNFFELEEIINNEIKKKFNSNNNNNINFNVNDYEKSFFCQADYFEFSEGSN